MGNADVRLDRADIRNVGGKAIGLLRLDAAGIAVPPWRALEAAHGQAHLERVRSRNTSAPEGLSPRERALSEPLDASTEARIATILDELDCEFVAVRSSGLAEDGSDESLAGRFETVLGVRADDPGAIADSVRRCWASALPDAVPDEAEEPTAAETPMAVVIQKMVDPHAAGVAFTLDERVLVSAAYGLGEGLVSGAVDADSAVLDTAGGVLAERIGAKESAFRRVGGDVHELEVVPAERAESALSREQYRTLGKALAKITDALGPRQDVEFAFDDAGLHILQCRPVTATTPVPDLPVPVGIDDLVSAERVGAGEARLWDNSNILESFNGPTSPLTFSTASNVYRHVYDGYARSLRVPRAQLKQVAEWTPHLLGQFYGRVYYDLLHWYRMVGIAPGYALNRRVLEVALGVGEPLDSRVARTLKPFTFRSPVHRLVSRAITTATYVRRIATVESFVDDFLREFDAIYARFDALDYDTMDGTEVLARFEELESELLRRWGPVMVLDAALLTLSGLLFALTKVLLPNAPEWFGFAAIAPGEDIESAEPAHALADMAALIDDEAVAERIRRGDPAEVYEWIREHGPEKLRSAADEYIDNYGYRSLDELKLEIPDLREDPSMLVVLLRAAMAGGAPNRGEDAEAYLDANLHGVRRRVYEALRRKTSAGAAARERLRFARTRAFGMVKRMVRAMGRDLAARGVLGEFDDVFFLTLDELRAQLRGGTASDGGDAARASVARRREALHLSRSVAGPARFWTSGPVSGRGELAELGFVARSGLPAAEVGDELSGVASSSGVAEGTVVVVDSPADIREGILVGYRTDPGWATALPAAKALLIERGSPLTHVAIIARELGIPTVVQIENLTSLLRDGMTVRVDATAGTVTVLSGAEESETTSDEEARR